MYFLIVILAGNVYRVLTTTGDAEPVASFSLRNTGLRFRLRACSQVTVNLVADHYTQSSVTYQVVLAATQNTESKLYKIRNGQGELLQQASTPNLVQCDAIIHFWIETSVSGRIAVGQSYVSGQSAFLSHTDPFPLPIHGVMMSSADGDADWEIPTDLGNNTAYNTIH